MKERRGGYGERRSLRGGGDCRLSVPGAKIGVSLKKDQSGKYKVREGRRRSPEDDRGGRTVPKPEAQKRNKVWRLLSLSFFLFFLQN